MKNARQTAAELLLKMEKGAYSNIALNAALSDEKLSAVDKKLISRLFYGVTERKLTLDYVISRYSKRNVRKLDMEVLTLLRMGIYEILYCDNIPESASVNEAVMLAKSMGKSSASGFVNGILRTFIRNGGKYDLPKDKTEEFSVRYSVSKDIANILIDSLSYEDAASVLEYSFLESNMTVRVNTMKTNINELSEAFLSEGIEAVPVNIPFLKGKALKIISGSGKALKSKMFSRGLFHVQDISSQICAYAVSPDENDTVIDICAAPGGKSFTISEEMHGNGKIYSCELHEKRVRLIEKGAEKLGLANIAAVQNNGTIYNEKLPAADKVLCDVPCSGLGTMRSKPEIKYKSAEDIKNLPKIQYDILETSSRYVKSGGYLIYSTCTLNRAENDFVTDKFLNEHPEFYGVPFLSGNDKYSVTILPRDFDSDGFYICKMRRK